MSEAHEIAAGVRVRVRGERWTGQGSQLGTAQGSPRSGRVLVLFDDGALVDIDATSLLAE